MARASLFTDHKISGLPIRATYKHLKTIWADTFDNFPTDPISSSLNWWSSILGVATLCSCWIDLFASSPNLSTHLFAGPSISWDQDEMFASEFSGSGNFFYTSSWYPGFKQNLFNSPQYLCLLCILFECNQINMVKEWCWFSQINFFHEYCPHRINILFLSSQFDVIHMHR